MSISGQNGPKWPQNSPKRPENGPKWSTTPFYDFYSFWSKITKMTQNDPTRKNMVLALCTTLLWQYCGITVAFLWHYWICLVHKEKVGPKKSYHYLICHVHKEKVSPKMWEGEGGGWLEPPSISWPKQSFHYTKPSAEPLQGFHLGDPNPIPLEYHNFGCV